MPSIQIKNVPEETHAVLRRRAQASGQSLQEYIRSKLVRDAAQPTMREVSAAEEPYRQEVPMAEILTALEASRAGR